MYFQATGNSGGDGRCHLCATIDIEDETKGLITSLHQEPFQHNIRGKDDPSPIVSFPEASLHGGAHEVSGTVAQNRCDPLTHPTQIQRQPFTWLLVIFYFFLFWGEEGRGDGNLFRDMYPLHDHETGN